MLKEFINQTPSEQVANTFTPAMNLLLNVLNWDFSKYDPRQTNPERKRKTQPAELAPPEDWVPKLTDTMLIEVLVSIHDRYREHEISGLIRQSLFQLASLSRVRFKYY
jgi:hypothetical protein